MSDGNEGVLVPRQFAERLLRAVHAAQLEFDRGIQTAWTKSSVCFGTVPREQRRELSVPRVPLGGRVRGAALRTQGDRGLRTSSPLFAIQIARGSGFDPASCRRISKTS